MNGKKTKDQMRVLRSTISARQDIKRLSKPDSVNSARNPHEVVRLDRTEMATLSTCPECGYSAGRHSGRCERA